MMTAIELLQVTGLVVVTLFARAALVVAGVMLLATPGILFAYGARAVTAAWHRHHAPHHA